MVELELFYSQLSSIMEVLVRSAIADIGKLIEDYTASLLEISRGQRESEALKSKPLGLLSDQGDTRTFQEECFALGQKLEENCRSDSDQVAASDCEHQNVQRDNLTQTTLHQVCKKWKDQRSSQENYPQPEMCVQEQTHLTLKEEHIKPLPCQIKKEMQVEDTFLNTVPVDEAGWCEEQHQTCSVKMEIPSPCIQSSPADGTIEPYGRSLTHRQLSSMESVQPNLDLVTLEPDLCAGTLGNPLPDHFSHSPSYSNHPPNNPPLPTDLDVSAEKTSAPVLAIADGHGSEVAIVRQRNSSKFARFLCKYCGQAFPYLSQLKRHMPKHTKERPFCCSLCGFCFTRMSHLKRHERSHTGDRPYACEVCGRCFIRKSHLDQHLKTHQRTALRYSAHCT